VEPSTIRHRADIDGLRAVAVVAVILGHLELPFVTGGFVGVDVFFVISGFLITSLIIRDLHDRRFSLAGFYERRVRRIAPAFFAMTAWSSLAAWFLLPPSDLSRYGQSIAASSTFSSNLLFWTQEGYFDGLGHGKPMLHTWSLAIEEQFYLLFPLLLMALFRWGHRRAARWVAGVFLVSLAASIWTTTHAPRVAFYHMPLRGWELLAGGLLALGVVPPLRPAWSRELASIVGALLLGWSIATFSRETAFPGMNALLPCAGAALLIHAHDGSRSSPPTWVARLLQLRPVVFIGAISYSLYLWHWPVIVFSRSWLPASQPAYLAGLLVLIVGLSVLSWKYVEQPFRHRPHRGSRRNVALGFFAATALTVSVGLAAVGTGGWPGRVSAEVLALDQAELDYNHDRPRCHGNDRRPIRFEDKCAYGASAVPPSVAIWGDSMAVELAAALGSELAARGRSLLAISYSSCPPSVGMSFTDRPGCKDHNGRMLTRLVESKAITKVILVAQYLPQWWRFGPRFFVSLEEIATTLVGAGKEVYIVYPIPTPPGRVPAMLAGRALLGMDPRQVFISRAGHDAENRDTIAALDRLTQRPHITALRPTDRLCSATRCEVFADGAVLYFDDVHLSVTGARRVMPVFLPAIE
jgi:peptidoglycan/LPS O-acetylase OafA/YrhL